MNISILTANQGENFGHVIIEALAAGKPVLISDQTPWRGLENHKAGWDIPLNDKEKFISILEMLVDMEPENEYNKWSYSAQIILKKYTNDSDLKESYINLFH